LLTRSLRALLQLATTPVRAERLQPPLSSGGGGGGGGGGGSGAPAGAPAADRKRTGRKRVMILMSDTGGGHRASAEALKASFQIQFGAPARISSVRCVLTFLYPRACVGALFFSRFKPLSLNALPSRARAARPPRGAGNGYDVSIVDLWSHHSPYPTNKLPKSCALHTHSINTHTHALKRPSRLTHTFRKFAFSCLSLPPATTSW
jgi:hypothetical protein